MIDWREFSLGMVASGVEQRRLIGRYASFTE